MVQLSDTDHVYKQNTTVAIKGNTSSDLKEDGNLWYYTVHAQNFCSGATIASTNGSGPEQEPLYFQMTLQGSNEKKI